MPFHVESSLWHLLLELPRTLQEARKGWTHSVTCGAPVPVPTVQAPAEVCLLKCSSGLAQGRLPTPAHEKTPFPFNLSLA